jgi:serine protease Do
VKSLGLGLADLTDAQRRELKVKGGVRVESVEGPAARAGLREGDVILALDNTEVSDVRQFQSLVQKADKNKSLSVLVRRGEGVNYFVLRPSR